MRILLIGATSYVASYFIEECLRRGWDVTAMSHDRIRGTILSPRSGGVRMVAGLDEALALGSVDAVVNFAYPTDLGAMKIHAATRRLIAEVIAAAQRLSPRIVVQVSTQSVFGYSLAQEAGPVPVWWAAGDSYIETKALAEALLLLQSRRAPYVKVILRLGNVIGPGAYWVSVIAEHILFERPLGRGISNSTYVRNVADYLAHLLRTDEATLRAFGIFHHLAEFSSYPWARIAEPIADAMGLRASYSEDLIRPVRNGRSGVLKAAVRHLAMFLPGLWQDRIDGVYAAVRRRFPPRDVADGEQSDAHPTLHQLVQFKSHTLPGWEARFDLQAALDETIAWVRDAGYVASA